MVVVVVVVGMMVGPVPSQATIIIIDIYSLEPLKFTHDLPDEHLGLSSVIFKEGEKSSERTWRRAIVDKIPDIIANADATKLFEAADA